MENLFTRSLDVFITGVRADPRLRGHAKLVQREGQATNVGFSV